MEGAERRPVAARSIAWINHPRFIRVCAFAVAAGLAYAAWSYESELNVRKPPVLRVHRERASHGRGRAARVVWVLIDGLRLDASREMSALNRLRAQGEDVSGRAEFPTFSGPNFVAQASGIEPPGSGVLSNGYPGEVALDSVFRRAKMAGLRTAVLTTDPDPGLSSIYASWMDDTVVEDPDVHLPPASLVFVHIGYVDRAGHRWGAASPQYSAAVARADEAIGRVARALDPAREALIVTSDHGHLDEGGHGGTERSVVRIPIVVWGAGAVHRTRAGHGRDVGPTIARLLGIGPLSHATGRPLVRGDAITSRQRAAARAAVYAAGTAQVEHVPIAVPIAVVALLVLGGASGVEMRTLVSSPTYALVFAVLLLVTHTLSFSIANHSAVFGTRLTALSALAALAQLRVGGRSSLVPAALVASLAVLWTALVAAHETRTPLDGTLWFLPIPALAGLAFICLMTAIAGRRCIVFTD
jgi:type I phosphodiesterase/nucleotide pyrophosphatase